MVSIPGKLVFVGGGGNSAKARGRRTMGHRLSDSDWQLIMDTAQADHTIARMIAEEYTWGWSTCWFAETGEFNHFLMKPRNDSYADGMIHALFGWWWESEGGREPTVRDLHARKLMVAYLGQREEVYGMGPVAGFEALWPSKN